MNITLKIPGNPTTLILAEILFCSFCLLMFLIRRLPLKIKFTELDFWTLLVTLCVAVGYLRNPVGLNIFGGSSLGGRPYAIFALTLVTSLILRNFRMPVAGLKWLLKLNIIGGLAHFAFLSVGYFIPQLGVMIGSATALANDESGSGAGNGGQKATKLAFLGTLSERLALWIGAFKSPIKACFHPIWAPLILISFGFAAMSGYRSQIAATGLAYVVAIAYRGGFKSILIASAAFIFAIASLALTNLTSPLPANIQRSLTFLPGTWDEFHKKEAEDSTEWRVEMWEEALFTDDWIKNKFIGDGLGITRDEFEYILSLGGINETSGTKGKGNLSLQQEIMMASNAYHSGPVSTIRVIGYFGLLILLLAQIRLAVHAHRQIKRTKNTEWFPLALLIGIPMISTPVFFVFVFGTFDEAISGFLLGTAFVQILKNNLPLPVYIPTNQYRSLGKTTHLA